MNLRHEIIKTVNNSELTDKDIYNSVRFTLNNYKRITRARKTYNLQYTEKVSNRNQLSSLVRLPGKTLAAINLKLYHINKTGFSPSNEDVVLTKEICRILKMKKSDLIIDFPY